MRENGASRNPYDGMTEDALRDELAKQTRLLAAGDPAAADPANPPEGTSDDDR